MPPLHGETPRQSSCPVMCEGQLSQPFRPMSSSRLFLVLVHLCSKVYQFQYTSLLEKRQPLAAKDVLSLLHDLVVCKYRIR